MNITGGIYRWRYTSHVQLLFYTLTTVIFLDVHVISLIQVECATAQTGPQLQIVLFGLLDEDHVACRLLLADSRIARSSLVFGFRPEDERGLRGSLLTPP